LILVTETFDVFYLLVFYLPVFYLLLSAKNRFRKSSKSSIVSLWLLPLLVDTVVLAVSVLCPTSLCVVTVLSTVPVELSVVQVVSPFSREFESLEPLEQEPSLFVHAPSRFLPSFEHLPSVPQAEESLVYLPLQFLSSFGHFPSHFLPSVVPVAPLGQSHFLPSAVQSQVHLHGFSQVSQTHLHEHVLSIDSPFTPVAVSVEPLELLGSHVLLFALQVVSSALLALLPVLQVVSPAAHVDVSSSTAVSVSSSAVFSSPATAVSLFPD
jgi:hypothetical protein